MIGSKTILSRTASLQANVSCGSSAIVIKISS